MSKIKTKLQTGYITFTHKDDSQTLKIKEIKKVEKVEPYDKYLSKVFALLDDDVSHRLFKSINPAPDVTSIVDNIRFIVTNKELQKAVYTVVDDIPKHDLPKGFDPDKQTLGYTREKTWDYYDYNDLLSLILLTRMLQFNVMSLKHCYKLPREYLRPMRETGVFDLPGIVKIAKYTETSLSGANVMAFGLDKREFVDNIIFEILLGALSTMPLATSGKTAPGVVNLTLSVINNKIKRAKRSPNNIISNTTANGDVVDVMSNLNTVSQDSLITLVLNAQAKELQNTHAISDDDWKKVLQYEQTLINNSQYKINAVNRLLALIVLKPRIDIIDLAVEDIPIVLATTRYILDKCDSSNVSEDTIDGLQILSTALIQAKETETIVNASGNLSYSTLNTIKEGLSSLDIKKDPLISSAFNTLDRAVLIDPMTGRRVRLRNTKQMLTQAIAWLGELNAISVLNLK